MTMRSPIVAMLWENWRLSRNEAAQRLAQGIVAASAALTFFDADATIAFWILIATHAFFWFSIAKLNGGRFMDGYKPGFPLYLLYSRPVPTVTIVGVAMVYDAVSCTAFYLVSAAFLRFAFGPALPLFSMTVFLMAYHFACTCVQWSTRNRVVQWIGSMVTFFPFLALLKNRMASPLQVEFSLLENALMALVGVVSFGLTVAGVARQRRGDAIASVPRTAGSGGYPDWLVTLFRFPCPTSSATRAQVWFELRSSGFPVLAIGLALAMLIPLLFAISIPFEPARHATVSFMALAVPVVLLALGGNVFGIRRRQGRIYASAFEATQPYATAQLVGLKVLVRTACLLAALIAIGVSVAASSSLMSAWGEWLADGKKDALPGLLQLRRTIGDSFGALTGYAIAAQVVIASVVVAVMVASFATFTALRARYPRRLIVAGSLLLLWSIAIILLGLAARRGIGPEFLLGAILRATRWSAATAVVFAATYLFWSGFAERVLTIRYAGGAVAISAAFGAAWLTALHIAGVQLAGMSATNAISVVSPALLPLMASVLAPWSLSRIRHT